MDNISLINDRISDQRVRAREGLARLAAMTVAVGRPKLTESQVDRIAQAFAVHPPEVFNAVMARSDRYGQDPMAQIAAALDYELIRWRERIRSFVPARLDRSAAWSEVATLICRGAA